MKYARIFNQYKYELQKSPKDFNLWPGDGNLGDCIQSLGVENVYKKAGIASGDLALVNRDDLKDYNGENVSLVMQSWYGDYANIFPLPWSDKISPIFVGFHLNDINATREKFVSEKIYKKFEPYQPIGCRDRSTRDFLQKLGIDSYFSGCMTLTFDKRTQEPENGKVFLVDVSRRVLKRLPRKIKEIGDSSITQFYYWDTYPVSWEGAQEFEQHARNVLERYKNEAKLVITSKIHVAMPCVAMGISVIFIHEDSKNVRFDVLKGILPRYTHKDMRFIDWNPQPSNIDNLKSAIIDNAIASITGKNKEACNAHLLSQTDKLKEIEFLPSIVKTFRKLKIVSLKNEYKDKIKTKYLIILGVKIKIKTKQIQ